jgi:hypothetical protein
MLFALSFLMCALLAFWVWMRGMKLDDQMNFFFARNKEFDERFFDLEKRLHMLSTELNQNVGEPHVRPSSNNQEDQGNETT